jgi:hypothetical protein
MPVVRPSRPEPAGSGAGSPASGVRPDRRRRPATPDSPRPSAGPAIHKATRRPGPNWTSTTEPEPDRGARRDRATRGPAARQAWSSPSPAPHDHQPPARQFAELGGHLADAVGPAGEPRTATTDQRAEQFRPGDVLGAIHHIKLGEPPPHRERTRIVELADDRLLPPLAQYLAGQLTLGRVHLLRGRGRRSHRRGPACPDDQTHHERCQTGDERAGPGRRLQALGRA